MDYKNQPIPEGINVSKEHPLKEFLLLTSGVGVFIIAAVFVLSLLAEQLVDFIPFKTETMLADQFLKELVATEAPSANQQAVENYLQALADELLIAQHLPEDMGITLHYREEDTVNAFATLGGHIVIYRGLLEKIPHENALAMLLAHEMAHIKHRHPIVAMGRGLTTSLALASLSGLGNQAAGFFVQQLGISTSLSFNRQQEEQADETALETLKGYYGHSQGAADLFLILQGLDSQLEPPQLFSTHPHIGSRLARLEIHGHHTESYHIQPLPKAIRDYFD